MNVKTSFPCLLTFAGMEVQRPKRQVSSEVEGEGLSSSAGTADSPDLYVKSGASDDPSNDAATPDLSPPSSSPPHTPPPPARPTQRSRSARFHRQSAVDHTDRTKEGGERGEKGGVGGQTEIQVLMEGGSGGGEGGGGGKGEYPRANSWSEDKRRGVLSKGGGGVSGRGASRTNGHKHSSSNHKSREHGSSNHRQARGDRWTESSSSASWTSGHRGVHGRGGRLLEQDEEKISNYEMEMKPLQPRDSTTHKPHGHGEERHGHSHAHGEGRSHTVQRQRHKNRDGREGGEGRDGKEGREAGKDSHKLDKAGDKMDSRPLRRDLTLSPPLKSSPITPEQQDRSLTQSKGNSVRLTLSTPTQLYHTDFRLTKQLTAETSSTWHHTNHLEIVSVVIG